MHRPARRARQTDDFVDRDRRRAEKLLHHSKRILAIREGRVDFEVIDQTIRYAGRIDLKGGMIRVLPGESGCIVEMATYYDLRAAWLRPLRPAIDYVVKAMHRIVLADMRARLEPAPAAEPSYG